MKDNRFSLDNFLKEEDKHNFVLYVPEIIHTNWKINNNGKVLLIFDVNNPITKIAAWLLKKKPNKDIEFDELCTSAWLNIDGEKCIFEIAKIQKQNSNDNFKDSLIRLIKFMHYIQGRRWIRYKKVKAKEDVDISK
ncbi:PqqD family peptide modification chaperone [Brachyspira pilosicoli]|uniref:PqqD family peptide modification chaperone n=1 Tax=Brachyspira pilosicoli TaxID=52584 RepID=UPI001CA4EA90|nr:PqqD family peptide modification chaperone [Brachyspira pilosicoli]MBW5398678.1 PqqD family peptide modification chaperone [Brachyspira pilosicoli]